MNKIALILPVDWAHDLVMVKCFSKMSITERKNVSVSRWSQLRTTE